MPSHRYVVVDVFTDTKLAGNQLAVFTDARGIDEELLQPLAREINFSETVFVLPAEGEGHVHIRIFTPATEVPFAGHPCLGTAFVLAAPLQLDEIRLETGAGVIPVRLEREDGRQHGAQGHERQPPHRQHQPDGRSAPRPGLGARAGAPGPAVATQAGRRRGAGGFGRDRRARSRGRWRRRGLAPAHRSASGLAGGPPAPPRGCGSPAMTAETTRLSR